MRRVFEDWGYRRYEWKCDSLNAPLIAAARRLVDLMPETAGVSRLQLETAVARGR